MTDTVHLWKRILSNKIPIKGTIWNIVGDSWAARHTMLYIPELSISLDIGKESEQHPTHIFISHAHCDHTKGLASHLLEPIGTPIIFVPKPSANNIKDLVTSYYKSTKHSNAFQIKWKIIEVSISNENTMEEPLFLSEIFTIKNIPFKIELFKCHHSIPATGYGFVELRTKLDDKYIGLSQDEINEIKSNNQQVTKTIEIPHFCYLGDTTHNIFYIDKNCTITNPNIEKYGTIIVECTFLDPDDINKAKKTKHMHWDKLKPYIVAHPNINFILFHFSIKYKSKKIIDFFKSDNLPNVFPLVHDEEEYWMNKLIEKIQSNDVSEDVKQKLITSINTCSECNIKI